MTRRLYIVVEGDTEEEFVKTVLRPHFQSLGIYSVDVTKITTNPRLARKGGFVNYAHLKNDVRRLLNQPDVVVTMFVDFYALPTSVPGYELASRKSETAEKIRLLENAIASDINDSRFVPYIQRHEFESLLFASERGFSVYFSQSLKAVARILAQFDNPEDINDGPETAPSKRLLQIIPGYQKVFHGNILALEIGLETMLNKCPGLKRWVSRLSDELLNHTKG